MRDIKFRAWDEQNQEMTHEVSVWCYEKDTPVYDGTVTDKVTGDEIYSFPIDGEKTNTFLMQFTGLKDRNGKEIYEGDIVNYDWNWLNTDETREFLNKKGYKPRVGSIEFEISPTCGYIINPGRLLLRNDTYILEVVGNIHETPELIT